jgi:hypothetical protein
MSVRHWAKDRLADWNRKAVDEAQLQTIARGFEVLGKLVDGPEGRDKPEGSPPLTDDLVTAARRGATAPLTVEDWKNRIRGRETTSDALRRFGDTSEKLLFAYIGRTQVSSGSAVLVLPDTAWARATIRVLPLLGRFEKTDWTSLLKRSPGTWIASEKLHAPLRTAPASRKQVRRGRLHEWPDSKTIPHLSTLLAL